MKDYKFYLEYPTLKDRRSSTRKNKVNHSGNCLAIIKGTTQPGSDPLEDCIGAAFMWPNSECCFTSCSWSYLKQCIRISESEAREIHSNLFKYLEQ